jgi:GNAT superfamily N-acetyltransferase
MPRERIAARCDRRSFRRDRGAAGRLCAKPRDPRVEPLPLLADYREIFAQSEVWLADEPEGLGGVLILQPRPEDLLIWSVATAPFARTRGVGNRMLAFAEMRARELEVTSIRLYTGEPLTANIAWYTRHGYAHERLEDMGDRRIVHLIKQL